MDGDQPRVRVLMLWFANEDGFYFGTFSPKEFVRQLRENPKVEVCFYNNPPDLGGAKMLRMMGEVEFVDDEGLKDRFVQERLFLEIIAGQPIRPLTEIFCMHHGDAHFWTMTDVLHEPELEHLPFWASANGSDGAGKAHNKHQDS